MIGLKYLKSINLRKLLKSPFNNDVSTYGSLVFNCILVGFNL